MFLQYYVTESTTGNRVNIEINAATKTDLDATRNGWQTVWNTDFILDPQKEKYAAKTEDGEIIALGAYRVRKGSVAVYIAYIESQPESNPTLVEHKKYSGIGKAMIAFGIQLSIDASCNGVVVFEAKTDDLEQHYIRDYFIIAGTSKVYKTPFKVAFDDKICVIILSLPFTMFTSLSSPFHDTSAPIASLTNRIGTSVLSLKIYGFASGNSI